MYVLSTLRRSLCCTWLLVLSACSIAAPSAVLPTPQVFTTIEPTDTVSVSATSGIPDVSFDITTYRDESAGFELDYPASWSADPPQVGGDRGYFSQITSWFRNPGELPEFVPEGETYLSITVLLWDPKNDLDAFVATRKEGWSASDFDIVAELELVLSGNWRAFQYRIQSPEAVTYYLITTVGERYLVISGSGDLDLLAEIGSTLRPLTGSQ